MVPFYIAFVIAGYEKDVHVQRAKRLQVFQTEVTTVKQVTTNQQRISVMMANLLANAFQMTRRIRPDMNIADEHQSDSLADFCGCQTKCFDGDAAAIHQRTDCQAQSRRHRHHRNRPVIHRWQQCRRKGKAGHPQRNKAGTHPVIDKGLQHLVGNACHKIEPDQEKHQQGGHQRPRLKDGVPRKKRRKRNKGKHVEAIRHNKHDGDECDRADHAEMPPDRNENWRLTTCEWRIGRGMENWGRGMENWRIRRP